MPPHEWKAAQLSKYTAAKEKVEASPRSFNDERRRSAPVSGFHQWKRFLSLLHTFNALWTSSKAILNRFLALTSCFHSKSSSLIHYGGCWCLILRFTVLFLAPPPAVFSFFSVRSWDSVAEGHSSLKRVVKITCTNAHNILRILGQNSSQLDAEHGFIRRFHNRTVHHFLRCLLTFWTTNQLSKHTSAVSSLVPFVLSIILHGFTHKKQAEAEKSAS